MQSLLGMQPQVYYIMLDARDETTGIDRATVIMHAYGVLAIHLSTGRPADAIMSLLPV